MSEERKLPFVWEMKHEDAVSHAMGAVNVRSMPRPENYTKDIVHYLDGKDIVFVESVVPDAGTLDYAVVDIARDKELILRRISTKDESKKFYLYYSALINNREAAAAYKKGDEAELKIIYGAPMDSHNAINTNIVEQSIRFIKALPTLLAANLAHFLVEPSLLTLYQENGIKIKRIQ